MFAASGAYLFGLLAAIIWGLSGVVAKRGLTNGGSPMLLALLSGGVGSTIFWGVLAAQRGGGLFAHLTPAMIGIFALAGLVASCVGRVSHFVGVDRVGATVANAAVTVHPMFSVTLALLFIGEPVRFIELSGMLVIIAGLVVLALSRGGDVKGWKGWEVLIPIGAAFLFGVGDVLRRYAFITTGASSLEGAAVNSLAALTGFTVYVLLSGRWAAFRVSRTTYWYIGVAAVLTPLGLLSLLTGLSLGRVVVVVPLAATVPLFTIVFSYLLIGDLERVTRGVVVGSAAIVFGIYLITGV